MKNKDEKYIEAVERNIGLHESIKAQGTVKVGKYAGATLAQAKSALGVKDSDDHYDTRINKLIK
jgi:hypothetical protein